MVRPITKSHFPKKFASSLDLGLQDLEAILALSSRLELGLPGLRGVRIRPNTQFSSLDLGLPGFKGVRIKPNSQFYRSELGLLSICEVTCSPIEKKCFGNRPTKY